MSLNLAEIKEQATASKKDYGRLEEGTHHARIVSVVDFGLQEQTDYNTKEVIKPKERMMITWEFPTERIEIEQDDGTTKSLPRWQGKEYTISLHEKAGLTALLAAIAPSVETLEELLNMPCAVSIGSTSGGNAKVTNVSKPMKGFEVPELENESMYFDFSNPNKDLFLSLPAWQQAKIKDALNYDGFADDWKAEDNSEY